MNSSGALVLLCAIYAVHLARGQIYLATDVTFSNLTPDGNGIWTNLRYCGWDATSIACPTTAWSCTGQPRWSTDSNCGYPTSVNIRMSEFSRQCRWGYSLSGSDPPSGFGFQSSSGFLRVDKFGDSLKLGTGSHFNFPVGNGASSFKLVIAVRIYDKNINRIASGSYSFGYNIDETQNQCNDKGCPWNNAAAWNGPYQNNPDCYERCGFFSGCSIRLSDVSGWLGISSAGPDCCAYMTTKGNPCADKVSTPSRFDSTSVPFTISGRSYTLLFNGFSDPTTRTPKLYFLSQEGGSTQQDLYATIVVNCPACPAGSTPDRIINGQCSCTCTTTCSAGFLQTSDCRCIQCPTTCSSLAVQQSDCSCFCPYTSDTSYTGCTAPKTFSAAACACVCPSGGSPSSSWVQDPNTCTWYLPAAAASTTSLASITATTTNAATTAAAARTTTQAVVTTTQAASQAAVTTSTSTQATSTSSTQAQLTTSLSTAAASGTMQDSTSTTSASTSVVSTFAESTLATSSTSAVQEASTAAVSTSATLSTSATSVNEASTTALAAAAADAAATTSASADAASNAAAQALLTSATSSQAAEAAIASTSATSAAVSATEALSASAESASTAAVSQAAADAAAATSASTTAAVSITATGSALATSTTALQAAATTVVVFQNVTDVPRKLKKLPFIIGGGVAGAVLLAGIGVLIFFLYRASQSIWIASGESHKAFAIEDNPAFQASGLEKDNPAFNYL